MKKAMNWVGVQSSAIASVDYHKEEKVLFVLFRTGSIHAYHDVSEFKYKQLIDAPSVGAYFNTSIKKHHPETKEM